jgi:hypothetical protein
VVSIFEYGLNDIIRELLISLQILEASFLQTVQSTAIRPNPQNTVPILVKGPYGVGGGVVRQRVGRKLVVLEAIQPFGRPDPQTAVLPLMNGPHQVVRKSVLRAERVKLILVEIAQSSTIGSNPEPVAVVHMESADVING